MRVVWAKEHATARPPQEWVGLVFARAVSSHDEFAPSPPFSPLQLQGRNVWSLI